jgi:murein DD-endopeptidase MepM/ murein hydrolase activator NlpD
MGQLELSNWQKIKKIFTKTKSYTVIIVPDDGRNMNQKTIKTSFIKKGLVVAGLTLGLVVGIANYVYNITYTATKEHQELMNYRMTVSEQGKKIDELAKKTEALKQTINGLNDLENSVKKQLKKAGGKVETSKNVIKTDATSNVSMGGITMNGVSKLEALIEQNISLETNVKATKSELVALNSELKSHNYRVEVTPSRWPVAEGGTITSYYGKRSNPFGGGYDFHPGLDIGASYGSPIVATASGRVTRAGWYGGYGKYVAITHDFGYSSAYGHMSKIVVSPGEYVKKGETIGYLGSTGYSTGPHLHFEIKYYGKTLNPLKYIG